jgi:diguanylate cyclase (GGDEF)-like protein
MQAMQLVESTAPSSTSLGAVSRSDTPSSQETIRAAIERHGADVGGLDRDLSDLAVELGPSVWAVTLRLLCRLELASADARRHWKAVLAHQVTLSRALGRPVDYRVALADYFVAVDPRYQRPVLVDQRVLEDAEAGSLTDSLTGLHNYRYLEHALPHELSQAHRIGYPLALAFVDVDDFKAFNDHYGHADGNHVLARVAHTLGDSIRESDVACRYGGEEFVLILPGTDRFGALTVARRVVERVAALGIGAPTSEGVVTVSAGVAAFPADAAGATELLKAADAALYKAKASGKNRAELWTTERRSHKRVQTAFVGLTSTPGHDSVRLEGRDLSESGLYFVAPSRLPIGNALYLELRLPQETHDAIACHARVVRCEQLAQDSYGVGATIAHLPGPDRLKLQRALRQLS